MAGAEIRQFSADAQARSQNAMLAIGIGLLSAFADVMLLPLALAVFVIELNGTPRQLAFLSIMTGMVWMAAHLVAVGTGTGERRALPWATGALGLRAGAVLLLAFIARGADVLNDEQLLYRFFVCLVIATAAGGFGERPMALLLSRSIDQNRMAFVARARGIGALIGAAAGGFVLVRGYGDAAAVFPNNFTGFFMAAALALVGATLLTLRTNEPDRSTAIDPGKRERLLKDAVESLGIANVRKVVVQRVFHGALVAVDPFVIWFIFRELPIGIDEAGTYFGWYVGARIAGALLWRFVAERWDHRAVVTAGTMLRAIVPVVLVMLPHVEPTTFYRDRMADSFGVVQIVALLIGGLGLAQGAHGVSGGPYAAAVAATARGEGTLLLFNIATGLSSLLALVAAAVVMRRDGETLFLAVAGVGLVAVLLSGLLPQMAARARVRGDWSLRRVSAP